MAGTETLEEFYESKFSWLPDGLQQDLGHFNVFRLGPTKDGYCPAPPKYSRRSFYKISLFRGHSLFHYADKTMEINGCALLFFNPNVPYTIEALASDNTGYFCIFREAFFTEKIKGSLTELPMFAPGGKAAYILDAQQDKQISEIFEKMLAEIDSDYTFKYDLIRNYVMEMVHGANKMQASETLYQHTNAQSRITSVFTELLERQFPIESPAQRIALRSAKDYADQLSVHVNHLNRAIRETTGKTTSAHIAERLAAEAKALLKHTNWNIAEISYSLGFEEPAHFNHFFKKQTNVTPSSFRTV